MLSKYKVKSKTGWRSGNVGMGPSTSGPLRGLSVDHLNLTLLSSADSTVVTHLRSEVSWNRLVSHRYLESYSLPVKSNCEADGQLEAAEMTCGVGIGSFRPSLKPPVQR